MVCLETWLSLLYLKSSCGNFYIGRVVVMLICVLSVAAVHVLFSLAKSCNELFFNSYSILGINVHPYKLLYTLCSCKSISFWVGKRQDFNTALDLKKCSSKCVWDKTFKNLDVWYCILNQVDIILL